ncbi:MAG: hypothetical protein ABI297_08715 [Ginsengibacter sp.]
MNSTIYIAIFILVFLILFGFSISWFNHHKKKKDHKMLSEKFDDFVIKNQLAIDKKQEVHQGMIGIDRLNLKLVFLDNRSIPALFHVTNLEDIATCRLIKQKNAINGHISKISLQYILKNKKEADINIVFYDALHDDIFKMMRLSKEASFWEKRIHIFQQTAVLSEQNI